ncbi:MAG: GldG family protein [Clostridia bacterium]|nr:GldG family protein [Clostridia bacterium]
MAEKKTIGNRGTEGQTAGGMENAGKNRFMASISSGRTGKMGGYTSVMALIVIAAVIFVNLIAASIPSKYTKLDSSVNNIYTLSPASQRFVSSLKEDVTLWFVCTGGSDEEMLRIFLDRYAALSDRVKVKVIDPVKDPGLLVKYPDLESANNFSVLAEGAKRTKLVDYTDLYYYYNENAGEISVDMYNYYSQMYGSSATLESYYGPFTLFFSGDSRITGAIEYVTAEKVPTLYILEGHGEAELSATLVSALLDSSGVTHSSLNIALGDEIPEDCDVIVINSPTNDLTEAEAAALSGYFSDGGRILLLTNPAATLFPNLMKLASDAGMSAIPGTVSEGDSSRHYPRNSQYIYPSFNSEHEASSTSASYDGQLIAPSAHGISLDGGDGIVLTWLMKTSDRATTTESSEAASYVLAAAAEKGDGRFVWIGSADMISDTFINGTGGYNLALPDGIFGWMQSSYVSSLGNIEAISMSTSSLTVTEGQANFWGGLLIIVVPLACVAAAIVITVVRRRR